MRIAVTGGTGFIGSHVVELLLEAGHDVACLTLPAEGPGWLAGREVRFFEGNILAPDSLRPFLEGREAIVHLAGLTRAKSEAEFMAVNAGGAGAIIEVALSLSNPPRQIIAMSSLASVGPSPADGSCLDENAELNPITPYGRSKAALENLLKSYAGRIEYTIIRAPGVYGPRDKDFLQYFRMVARGLRIVIGPRNVLSIVYVKTLAKAIVSCVLNPAAYGQAFFIADDGTIDWDLLSEMIEKHLGRKTRRVRVPEWVVGAVALGSAAAKPFVRRPPLVTKNKILEMRQPCWIVSTAKAERLLGFKPLLSTEAALAETGAWYKAQGWI
jgi:dihydroflavonol-4-reductase